MVRSMVKSDNEARKENYIRTIFSSIAGYYDVINSILSLRRDRVWRDSVAQETRIPGNGLALDIATGTGELALHLANQNSDARIMGVDFCPEMLQQAKSKLKKYKTGAISLALGDALHLPFSENTFDAITMAFGLRNMADLSGAFNEMVRVVKPGGRIVTLELTRPSWRLGALVYRLSLFRVVPFVGQLVAGNKEAYTYLPESIIEFHSPEDIRKIMVRAGIRDVNIKRLSLGIATIHVGIKAI